MWRIAGLAACIVLAYWPAAGAGFQVLRGHGGPVMDTAVSPDGRTALTASFDNSVGVWDLETGAVRWLEGHTAAVKTAIFLGNDAAASAGDDFAIEVWSLPEGTRRHRLEGHKGQIAALAVSPDGVLLASASWDGTIGLWDPVAGRNLAVLSGHEGPVNDVVFADDGKALYSASADGTIRQWDPVTGRQERVSVRHGFGVTRLLIDDRAGWLAYGAVDGGTRVIDRASDAVLADLTLDRRPILALAGTPDGTGIAVGDGEGYIMVVGTADWAIRHDFHAAAQGPVWALAYTADGARLLAAGIDDAAYLWPMDDAPRDGTPVMARAERGFLRDPATMSNGERQFRRKCSVCHSLTDDGARRAGPTLYRLFGRTAGSVPGYPYSSMMAGSGIIWTDTTIDRLFDLGPDHYVPGSKMPMQRITAPKDRRDLIEFLKTHTSG